MSQDSFSAGVKNELSKKFSPDREGLRAELCAILITAARIRTHPWRMQIQSEQEAIIKKVFTLVEKLFRIKMSVSVRTGRGSRKWTQYMVALSDPDQVSHILTQLGLLSRSADGVWQFERRIPQGIGEKSSSKQAYIRGAFLGCGSLADPRKTYHVEFVSAFRHHLEMLQNLMRDFELEIRMITRSRRRQDVYVLYLKEGEQIVDLLNVMQAYTALMDLENIRIEKEMRNQINRSVNCEAANLQKVVNAALKQVEDIEYLISRSGWEALPPPLAQMARVRLEHQDESLQELGRFLDPPVGRSGVNHRLRKLSRMAEDLRRELDQEEKDQEEKLW